MDDIDDDGNVAVTPDIGEVQLALISDFVRESARDGSIPKAMVLEYGEGKLLLDAFKSYRHLLEGSEREDVWARALDELAYHYRFVSPLR